MATHRTIRSAVQRRPRWIGILAAVVAVAFVGVVGISVYVGWNLSHAPRKALDGDPSQYGLAYEDVEFLSAEDDVLLRGWFVPARADGAAVSDVRSGTADIESDVGTDIEGTAADVRVVAEAAPFPAGRATVIVAHGFRGNRLETGVPALGLTASLVDAGFNVLLFDFRNTGESEGTVTTLGYHEKKDIVGAVAWLKAQRPEAAAFVGVVGYSMGAVTAALAAAEEPAIDALILDSPFADLRPYLRENMPVWTGLPNVPFTWTIMTLLPPLIGLDPAAVSPLAAMPGLTQPVLLIHADGDEAIPVDNSWQLAAAGVQDRTELWIVPGGKHIGARSLDAEKYDRRVVEFFTQSR